MRPAGQCCANRHLDPLAQFVTEVLLLPDRRDVEDVTAFGDIAAALVDARARIAAFLERRRLRLYPRKTMILR